MTDVSARIVEREADAAAVEGLVLTGFSPLQARLLALRGVTAADCARFMEPSLADVPSLPPLPGAAEAADAVLDRVASGGEIVVFGDYDCDGICATAILVKTLNAVGGRVSPFLPDRLREGYGMGEASVARMLREHPCVSLVVTVDNGINSVAQVASLRARGIEVVVTDHHLPGDVLPGCVVVNPKVSSPAAFEGLCGSGVAFFLSREIVTRAQRRGIYSGPKIGGPLVVLAGLATVTDIMPLTGVNRDLVAAALQCFRRYAPVGLLELLDRASRSAAPLVARDFGFLIGPRINAAGRMSSGMEALELVLVNDRERARELARRVDMHNLARKEIEQRMTDSAFAQIVPGAPAQVIDVPGGHQGVSGIVASRVLERLGADGAVPVCVVVDGRGSARAPDGYNVRDAFAESADALLRFGGHAAAGGFSVKGGSIARFRELFCAACARQASSLTKPPAGAVQVDAVVCGRDLTFEFAKWLRAMEPFGEGNPNPVFAMRGVRIADVRPVGLEGRHLHVSFPGSGIPDALWWGKGGLAEGLRAGSAVPHDAVFTVEISTYGGEHAELRLTALAESGNAAL